MRSRSSLLALLTALSLACGPAQQPVTNPVQQPLPIKTIDKETTQTTTPKASIMYPQTRRESIVDNFFGVSVPDPYRWLEDVSKPEVQDWMNAQDALTRSNLASIPERDTIAARLKELYYVDSVSAPRQRGKRLFYTRTHKDKEKAVVYWKDGEKGEEKVLLDPNTMSADGTISLGTWVPSPDGKKVAYALRKNGADEASIHVLDVASGKESAIDVIEGGRYAYPSWTPKGDGFYYTYFPTDQTIPVPERPGHTDVRFHKLGTEVSKDQIVFEKTMNPKIFLGVDLSHDGRWLFLYKQYGWNRVDIFFRDTKSKDTKFTPLVEGKDAIYSVIAWKDKFYIQSNEGAPRGKIMLADPKKPEPANWTQLVAQEGNAVLDSFSLVGGKLSLSYLRDASNMLRIYNLDGKLDREVKLPGIGTASNLIGEPDQDTAYYSFNSYTQPTQIYQTSMKSGGDKVFFEVKLPIDTTKYTVEQIRYESKDGQRVSMFLVHKKDIKLDGSTPFLLYGYGGFSVNLQSSFSSGLYPWLEAGGGYAVPNLRGGGEYGEEWHRAGMLDKKQNVFDDFISAAEFLVNKGYTKPERLAIYGGSNGGLLVGAAMTQRPDLFRAVICSVPLLDMIRYHLFGSGKTWVEEYGSSEDEKGFQTLIGYSPYQKVKSAKYPALLMLSADNDDRVDPMHARKFVAAVQAATTSDLPVLLRVEKNAGHGGADLVKQAVEAGADRYAFLMRELGMSKK